MNSPQELEADSFKHDNELLLHSGARMLAGSVCGSFPDRCAGGLCTNLRCSLCTPGEHQRIRLQRAKPQQPQAKHNFLLHTEPLLGGQY